MEFVPTSIPDVVRIRPKIFGDSRGFFMEMYRRQTFEDQGMPPVFLQDNLSRSSRGVLRGLHYQIQQPQGKLVTVLNGSVFDVAVDLRKSSPTFGRWVGTVLSDENREMLYLPPGFAHGFYVLSETADFYYKCTDYYAPQHERTLLWNDPQVSIDWPIVGEPVLSPKDLAGKPLDQTEHFA